MTYSGKFRPAYRRQAAEERIEGPNHSAGPLAKGLKVSSVVVSNPHIGHSFSMPRERCT